MDKKIVELTEIISILMLMTLSCFANEWQDITTIEDADVLKSSKAIGILFLPRRKKRCTAFLVGKNLIMTNNHCVPTGVGAKGGRFYLGFTEGDSFFSKDNSESFKCGLKGVYNKKMDVALVKCVGDPGEKYGFLELNDTKLEYEDKKDVYLLHQNCDKRPCAPTKKVSFGFIYEIPRIPDFYASYKLKSLKGSSGGPVIDKETNKVVAIHSAKIGDHGSGTRMSVIVKLFNKWLCKE